MTRPQIRLTCAISITLYLVSGTAAGLAQDTGLRDPFAAPPEGAEPVSIFGVADSPRFLDAEQRETGVSQATTNGADSTAMGATPDTRAGESAPLANGDGGADRRLLAVFPKSVNPFRANLFENDFGYKLDPTNTQYVFGEELKLIPLGAHWRLSAGGELRHRHMNESNRLRPGGPGRSTYDLWRWRNYLDLRYEDFVRLYVEGIDASIFNQELPITPVDKNRWDLQNYFADIKLGTWADAPLWFRVGRQELLYGSQQLVSPLEWTNTRRNFEGFKLFAKAADWSLDAFATRPVNGATGHGPLSRLDNEFDQPDDDRWFSGVYATYKGLPNHSLDVYWLWLETDNEDHNPARADGDRHTIGARWVGRFPLGEDLANPSFVFHTDVEGGYQFGRDNGLRVDAGFFTSKFDLAFPRWVWKPSVRLLYYWGSGDRNPGDGETNTFDTLFPLGHAWWGIIDNVSGQNLQDYSVQATFRPVENLSGTMQMHWFDVASREDTIYNVAGVPVGVPGTGADVGEELDLIVTYVFGPNLNVQVGQSWFWYGSYINAGPAARPDASFFYVQTTLRY